MLAYANGAEIEWMHTHLKHWSPLPPEPVWNFNSFDYRVKPTPKVVKLSAYITENGQLIHYDMMKVKTWNGDWKRITSLDLEYTEDE